MYICIYIYMFVYWDILVLSSTGIYNQQLMNIDLWISMVPLDRHLPRFQLLLIEVGRSLRVWGRDHFLQFLGGRNTVDGCEILHHLKDDLDGWNPTKIMVASTGAGFLLSTVGNGPTRIRRSGFHVLNISYYSPRNGENQDDVKQIWIETRRSGGPRRKPRFWLPTRGTWWRRCLCFWCTFG